MADLVGHAHRFGRRGFGLVLASLAVPAVARAAPRRSTTALAAGTRWQTPAYLIDSGAPGPSVMVVAGIHGNEQAPPAAAKALLDEPIARGRVLVVPEANRPALTLRTRLVANSRHPDLNRSFPTADRAEPREGMAEALWRETVRYAPDWVLDLHEGWGFASSSTSMGSSIVIVPDARVEAAVIPMAERLLRAVNATVTDRRKRFKVIQPGPSGSFARAVTERLGRPSLVVETTWNQPMELRVAQQLLLVRTAFAALGLLPA
jgi:uncharacterized protein